MVSSLARCHSRVPHLRSVFLSSIRLFPPSVPSLTHSLRRYIALHHSFHSFVSLLAWLVLVKVMRAKGKRNRANERMNKKHKSQDLETDGFLMSCPYQRFARRSQSIVIHSLLFVSWVSLYRLSYVVPTAHSYVVSSHLSLSAPHSRSSA